MLAPVAVAGLLAAWSLNFGLPFLFRPDEDVMVGRAVRMAVDHSLDPLFYNYPPLGFWLLAAAEAGLGRIPGQHLGPATVVDPTAEYLVARVLSVVAFILAVLFVHLTARRTWGGLAGLVAGVALAVSPLAVRQAHFATTDGLAMALVAAALWAAVRARGQGGLLVAGAICGLAAATKYTSGAALVAVLVLAAMGPGSGRTGRLTAAVAGAAVPFAAVMVVAGHPRDYLQGLLFLGGRAGGAYDTPIGWIAHTTLSVPFGLGLGTTAVVAAGILVALLRRHALDVALLAFVVVYALLIGFSHEVFFRYVMPVLPALCVLAGGVARAAPGLTGRIAGAAGLIALLLTLPAAYASVQTDRLLGQTDTRRQAADWLLANAAPGSQLRISSYFAQPFYDSGELEQDKLLHLYQTGDPIADSFQLGRFTDRFRVNRPGSPCYTILESGPPWQYPTPASSGRVLARFTPYTGPVRGQAVYDRLDSFYLPLWGFEDLDDPGPAMVIVAGCG
ncbi:MAG: glycosyltransferase family 39 protein [Candidatus Dormibacteraeota bacterium]|nr:glycosyltransferase family 39 protein [Candidatus Dormibacteraeota bacterium]